MNGEPLVSVIIPVFNQGEYLHEAIDSVFAQEYSNFEIIVINDGSTDEYTIDILKNLKSIYKLRVINTANLGVVHARNIGIKECRGEYILPLDSDDKIGKEYITQAVDILTADKNVGIVYARAKYFGVVNGQMYLKKFSFCSTKYSFQYINKRRNKNGEISANQVIRDTTNFMPSIRKSLG